MQPAQPDSGTDHIAARKERELADWLRARGSALVGFSGGVDSTYLSQVTFETLGSARMLAVIGRSASYPLVQWEAARVIANACGMPVLEIETEELEDERYAANPTNRCYFCKHELWSKLVAVARQRELAVVIDGTNADDTADYRPGRRAAAEHGIASPLAELGFTKVEIRMRLRARGLTSWRQPSSPCLSSRLPYGTPVTVERLRQVEIAEAELRGAGVEGNLRVRHHGELARVELDQDELTDWLAPARLQLLRDAVRRGGFVRVALDLGGFRSGSLNVLSGVSTP